MTQKAAAQLLQSSGYLADTEESESLELNMNDIWGWALAWTESIPAEKVVEVGELFRLYGWCGLAYWVSEQHEQMRSEFKDVNRTIDFVRHEEALRKTEPNSTKRAYRKLVYTLGEDDVNVGT